MDKDNESTPIEYQKLAVSHITEALQAQEKLSWLMSQEDSYFSGSVRENTRCTLDNLRSIKSDLEGSNHDFVLPIVKEESLKELKQLTLMHVPGSVSDEIKMTFKSKVDQALKGQCKAVISITILTCPWYERSQRERGEQAKHNILLTVFVSHDEQFFSPANQHVKDQASVIDFGWFCAVELSHFSGALARGRSRYIETLYCREGALLWASEEWGELHKSLSFQSVAGTRGFREACLGQAFGGIGKKRKNGTFKLKEGSSIFEICESLRLLRLAEISLKSLPCDMEVTGPDQSSEAILALQTLDTFYESSNPLKCKQDLFNIAMEWMQALKKLSSEIRPTSSKSLQTHCDTAIGQWMMNIRLQGKSLKPCTSIPDSHSDLLTLMQNVGGPVSKMKPDQIIMIAVAGSAMYNLNTATSDVDYTVVFMEPTENLLSSPKKLTESYESRGVDKDLEYGAYEVRSFCEQLLKSSVVILELLFTESHQYTCPMWNELCAAKGKFVTEKAIQQYLGLVKNNFKSIERGRHSDSPKRDRKLFYQIFHKLHSLRSMIKGEVPEVRVEGEVRDFIMNVRTKNTGEWSRESILQEAQKQYKEFRKSMCSRANRLTENPDYDLCTKWIMKVRGMV